MLLVIDNYDSFTYNLVQYCGELGAEVSVIRNSAPLAQAFDIRPTHVLVSPGPCTPSEAGISLEAIHHFAGRVPVLGVCLGHQALGQTFGGRVVRADRLMHGKTSMVRHVADPLFASVPPVFQATRYHSLVVDRATLPSDFTVTAETDDAIMALRHRPTGAVGVQFHPESILTESGKTILANFLAS
ncbi:MAG: aminodeoxychorismate/anthranilate synthase component II [Alicyclobacillaceae bacterium]|nr:aminodeoxychorismate/anthranilate synthase component II [Alicyclobacillaceae bacterium]MCY0896569.1 aminodeoxychorismate/anthranilate synthase component II [Alicyclobacillaceae bacterium]